MVQKKSVTRFIRCHQPYKISYKTNRLRWFKENSQPVHYLKLIFSGNKITVSTSCGETSAFKFLLVVDIMLSVQASTMLYIVVAVSFRLKTVSFICSFFQIKVDPFCLFWTVQKWDRPPIVTQWFTPDFKPLYFRISKTLNPQGVLINWDNVPICQHFLGLFAHTSKIVTGN